MFVTLCGSLALLARLLTAALLLAGLLSRRLILLAGPVLFGHGVSFLSWKNTRPTARGSGSFLTKKKCGSPRRYYVSLTYSGLLSSSAIIIRTHNHRPTNKREPVFGSN